jgi:hypothetical protein
MRDHSTTLSRKLARGHGALLLGLAGALALALCATPALAGTGHGLSASFGGGVDKTHGTDICTFTSGDECGAGEAGSGNGQFSNPSGVAVNQSSGDLYVADRGNNRVEYFSATGSYLGQFNGSGTLSGEGSGAPTGEFSGPDYVAVDNSASVADPSQGDVYVLDSGHNVIDKYSASGAYVGQLTEAGDGAFGAMNGVAVDPNGVVWVYRDNSEIDSFSDALANSYLASITSPYQTSLGFAVDHEDNLYVNRGAELVAKLSSTGESLISEFDSETSTGVAVEPSGAAVYIDNLTSVGEFDSSGVLLARFGFGSLVSSHGIAVNPTSGSVYVSDATNDDVEIFATGSTPSAPSTEPAEAIENGSALLKGELTSGSEKVKAYFSYAPGASCTAPGAKTTTPVSAEANSKESATVSGLNPKEPYAFCLVTENAFGSSPGPAVTFTSAGAAPIVASQSAIEVRSVTATLEAQVNPNGEATHYYFEYGTSPSLTGAASAPTPPGTEIPPGLGNVTASQEVTGLQANTVYYYRVVAENGTGTTRGTPIESFTTNPLSPTAVTDGPSSVTQTGATLAGVVNGEGADTHYFFEFVQDAEYESSSFNPYFKGLLTPSEGVDAGVVSADLSVSTRLTGLQPNTTYHYRAGATNISCSFGESFVFCPVSGNVAYGADQTFTTLPLVPALIADPAVTVSAAAATLAGEVASQGADSTYHFEYGTSEALGTSTPAAVVGAATPLGSVGANLEGLQSGTTYYYRLVASNSGGEEATAIQRFTTSFVGEPPSSPPGGFSLTLTGNPPSSPAAVSFSNLAALTPVAPAKPLVTVTPTPKRLTRAQKLAQALKVCRKAKQKKTRRSCETRAQRQFGKQTKPRQK